MGLYLCKLFIKSGKSIEELGIDELNCIARFLTIDSVVNLSIASPYIGNCIKHTFISEHCKFRKPNSIKSFNYLYNSTCRSLFNQSKIKDQISRNIKYFEQFDIRIICNLFEAGALCHYLSEYQEVVPSPFIDRILIAIHRRAISIGYQTSSICFWTTERFELISKDYPELEKFTTPRVWTKEFLAHSTPELLKIVFGQIPRLYTFL